MTYLFGAALKATGQNTKAPRTQKQDSVKTSSNTGEVPQQIVQSLLNIKINKAILQK